MQVTDFGITEELLSSCSHTSNRYRMYLMGKNTEKQETAKGRKRKALQELVSAKKRNKELEIAANID